MEIQAYYSELIIVKEIGMEIVITGGLWRMGFRDTVTLYTFLYHLERSYMHECITTMIKKTNLTKKEGSGHGELSITL